MVGAKRYGPRFGGHFLSRRREHRLAFVGVGVLNIERAFDRGIKQFFFEIVVAEFAVHIGLHVGNTLQRRRDVHFQRAGHVVVNAALRIGIKKFHDFFDIGFADAVDRHFLFGRGNDGPIAADSKDLLSVTIQFRQSAVGVLAEINFLHHALVLFDVNGDVRRSGPSGNGFKQAARNGIKHPSLAVVINPFARVERELGPFGKNDGFSRFGVQWDPVGIVRIGPVIPLFRFHHNGCDLYLGFLHNVGQQRAIVRDPGDLSGFGIDAEIFLAGRKLRRHFAGALIKNAVFHFSFHGKFNGDNIGIFYSVKRRLPVDIGTARLFSDRDDLSGRRHHNVGQLAFSCTDEAQRQRRKFRLR